MLAVISKGSGDCIAYVNSPDGYDAALYDFVDLPGDPESLAWAKGSRTFVAKPKSVDDLVAAELAADPRWAALRGATPAQVDAWLANNVTDLQSARTVLRFLVLAIKRLAINAHTGL